MSRFKTSLFLSIGIGLLFTSICYSDNLFKTETQYSTAILKYEKGIIDNPKDPKLYYDLAKLRYAIGDRKKALKEFQKAKELYLDQGNIEAALQLETTLNTLTLPEALKEIEKRIEKLETEVKEIREGFKK